MVMECSYAVTAWTQAVEDEHRLLSQVLGVLFAFPQLPDDALTGRLRNGSQRFAIEAQGRPGQGRQGRLLDRRRRPVQGVARLRRHARVRVRRRVREVPAGADADHSHPAARRPGARRSSRCTASAARSPTPTASRSPTSGSRCPTRGCSPRPTPQGRFRFDRVPPGQHQLVARTRDGREADGGARRPRRAARSRPRRRQGRGRRPEDRQARMTEWAVDGARTALARGARRSRRGLRRWTTPAGRACCSATSSPSSAWGCAVLTEEGCEVVGEEERPSAIVGEVHRLRPDVVVLDLTAGPRSSSAAACGASPETKVILWARDEDAMEVLDPGATTRAGSPPRCRRSFAAS